MTRNTLAPTHDFLHDLSTYEGTRVSPAHAARRRVALRLDGLCGPSSHPRISSTGGPHLDSSDPSGRQPRDVRPGVPPGRLGELTACRDTASPLRKDRHARAITSLGRMYMDHEVFRLTPYSPAHALNDEPESMSLSISPFVSLNRRGHPTGGDRQLVSTVA